MKDQNVALIGMAGKFPGADSVSGFWDNLCAGRDGLRTLSSDALRGAGVRDDELANPDYVKVAAALNDVDRFDPAFFKVSPLEAELMDPQMRLMLQCAWETLEDAGYAGAGPQRIGVFAGAGGVTSSYFANFVNRHARFDRITAGATHIGNDKDFLATILSYKLNLTGPSVTVQTACSTSLVALHLARTSLLNGECEMALAGGVTVRVPHEHGYVYREGYIFSRSGRLRPFDVAADGVVFGSGLGLVLLKRLEEAERDGDHIYAVIKGSAIGNDGKGKMSYTASSARGQIACVRAALANAGVDAGSLGFVEAHGTGTAMGDPEEVKALSAAFREDTDRRGFCVLGAVKANVGHAEAAAGVIGLIKAALAVKHGVIPPATHYTAPNPRIRFENTPFRIDSELVTWQSDNAPRRAGVNSLGVGGTNAFVVLEQYPQQKRVRAKRSSRPVLVPLSARTLDSLRAYAARLAGFLEHAGAALDIADIAFTLQTGREAMACRAAFVVKSVEQLRGALLAYVERGEIAAPDANDQTGALAAAWTAGETVDWRERPRDAKTRRVSLPTYVFAKERCWIDEMPVAPASSMLHPLLHGNTSDLHEHRYSSMFGGDEIFLRDHLLVTPDDGNGAATARRILPGAAYLEIARAAFERSGHVPQAGRVAALRDIVWLQPLEVSAPTRVDIALIPGRDDIAFEVFGADSAVFCQGHIGWSDETGDALPAVDEAAAEVWGAERVYAVFASMGLRYGPAFRVIRTLSIGDGAARARVSLPDSVRAGAQEFGLHPGLLDGALQTATALLVDLGDPPGQPVVPFALDAVRLLAACPADIEVRVRFAGQRPAHGRLAKLDIDLCDLDGKVCVQLRGFAARGFASAPHDVLLATETWEAAAAHGDARTTSGQERRIVLCGLPQVDTAAFASLPASAGAPVATTHLPMLEGVDIAARYTQLSLDVFGVLQSMLRDKPASDTLVQFVVPASADNRLFAGLSGLLKTTRAENPLLAAQLIFADGTTDGATLAAWLAEDANAPDQTLIDRTGSARRVAQWRLLDDARQAAQSDPFGAGGPYRAGGVYVITGGLGGLGALFAHDIARRAASARIVVTGRAPQDDEAVAERANALFAELRASGGEPVYRQMLLDDAEQVRGAVSGILRDHGRIDGVFHCAGMTGDAFLLNKPVDTFRAVLAPKVAGTLNLHEALSDADPDFVVLFSSLSSALGNLGQGDYAAANGFMDRFAAYRNALVAAGQCRGRTLTIRWPLWRDGGMQLDADGRAQLERTTGIRPMSSATGLRMFERILAGGPDQTLVMEGEPAAMRRALGCAAPAAGGLGAAEATPASNTADTPDTCSVTSAASPETPEAFAKRTEAWLGAQLAARLKLPAERVEPGAALEDYGIDSIVALDLTRILEKTFGPLSKTLFFEYLNLGDLAAYFVRAHGATLAALFAASTPGASTAPGDATASARAKTTAAHVTSLRANRAAVRSGRGAPGDAIAIVGVSGRYPGARSIDAFWDVLRDGRDCIVEVPEDRWNWRDYYSEDRSQPGAHYSKWGGFIEDVDRFDARFFNVSPIEAQRLDPQERLFLEHAWHAIEDAGYTRAQLQIPHGDGLPGRVGVYAGAMYNEYQLLGAEASLAGRRAGFASNPASIANRVSYFLNLHGPSMVVDTMCSSSLTAIHVACQDLRLGRTALALAGGVNVTIHPNKYLMLSAGQFISGDGHCQSFGEGGDGYIPGEGVGVVVLKRLADATRDGDRIYAVIRGTALSHGGKTNGYTVPNPHAQANAIRDAFDDAGVDPRHVSYIEAHGTGTKLGDPIEVAALTGVFRERTADTAFCAIGSVKSNIGHGEAAAGIAGLTKVLLQMRHRQLVPSLHSSTLNQHIDFDATPFVVNQALRGWDAPVVDGRALPRIAGISSFGAGGSNAHLIVEEYVAPQAVAQTPATVLVPLSARTPEQLKEKARDLLAMLRDPASSVSLASVAYTLQVGREAMAERVGVLANSLETLRERLQAFVDGAADGTGGVSVHRGTVRGAPTIPATASASQAGPDMGDNELARVLDAWVAGHPIDWRRLYRVAPALISLPAYPFARQRYWFDVAADAATLRRHAVQVGRRASHPLLQRNTSDFDGQRFTSSFDGDEFFLTGEPGARALSAAATVEMARAAFDASLPGSRTAGVIELRGIAWARPGVATDAHSLAIALFDQHGDAARFEIHRTGADDETVHCQGEAAWVHVAAPARLDLAALRAAADEAQALVPLQLPVEMDAGRADYVLHPALVADALRVAAALADTQAQPSALATARIVLPGVQPEFAWIRPTADVQGAFDSAFDIDLCDRDGNPCLQLRGLRYPVAASVAQSRSSAVVLRVPAAPAPAVRRRVPIAAAAPAGIAQTTITQASLSRSRGVTLSAPAVFASTSVATEVLRKPVFAPGHAGADAYFGPNANHAQVKLFDDGDGVYTIELDTSELAPQCIESLLAALRAAEAASDLKVLMLKGGDVFLSGARDAHADAIALGLYRALAAFPYPTIAAMRGDARGAGFLVGALCDFMICGEAARYGFTMPDAQLFPNQIRALFDKRFGRRCAAGLLYLDPLVSGSRLRQMGWGGQLAAAGDVEALAQAFAVDLAGKSRLALRLLKQELARSMLGAVETLHAAVQTRSMTPSADAASIAPPDTAAFTQLRLQHDAPGALTITLCAAHREFDPHALAVELAQVRAALASAATAAAPRCIVLASEHPDFAPLGASDRDLTAVLALHEALRAFAQPLIAVLDRGASGAAWFTALGADLCLYADDGRYSVDGLLADPVLASRAVGAFARHFDTASMKWLMASDEQTGASLQQSFGAAWVTARERALADALELADALAAWPGDALAALKGGEPDEAAPELPVRPAEAALPERAQADAAQSAPLGPVALGSDVVTAIAHPDGVLEITMADRDARNMFSDALSRDLMRAFEYIAASRAYKIVVLTGYDQYFSAGGTRDTLIAIHSGRARFTDNPLFRLPLDCAIPVIAAMQGHGIGAGWSLGMFADLALFSEASRYRSPYMNYGFTPGAGATLVFPYTVGHDLARESLLSAREYSGAELAARGVAQPVLARDRVRDTALALASRLASASRTTLVALKQQWASSLRQQIDAALAHELAMHSETFVGQADTLARIEQGFAEVPAVQPAQNAPATRHADPAPSAGPAPEPAADLRAIAARLRELLAHELRMSEHEIGEDEPFVSLGLDSITGVTWIRRINELYGTDIEAVKVYSYPTLAQLAQHVASEVRARIGQAPAADTNTGANAGAAAALARKGNANAEPRGDERAAFGPAPLRSWRKRGSGRASARAAQRDTPAIAVIGMAGRFAHANSLDQFWRNIAAGHDAIDEVARERWDVARYYQPGEVAPGKTISRWLGALDGHDRFDAGFFRISPREARAMDPQQRVFLETCWHGIEHAGYDPKSLGGTRCGVFVGCAAGDYHQLSPREQLSGPGFTGSAPSILAARIAYLLDLQGPSLAIDTACSSSLVAIANACDSLVAGASDLALAGGVTVLSGPAMHIMTSQMGMLSPHGRCYTFDDRADGIALGEGVGVVVLKRLADAERDGDCIYGVVQGWGVNQDGRTNGITAPNAEAQARLQQEVYERFGIDPASIGLVEAHGTGTALGDPIEVAALKASFAKHTRRTNYCAIGSVKSNIGHCLSAAGVSGFIKALLAIGQRQLPPAAHFRQLNRHIRLQDSPFYVNDTLRPWPADGDAPRRAAINSFGFSGTNAHAVIAEYRGRADHAAPREDALVPLSASTPAALVQKARDLLEWLDTEPARDGDFTRVAHTLQTGREPMSERVAIIASSRDDLRAKLATFVAHKDGGNGSSARIHRGDVAANRDTLRELNDDADFRAMIGKWITQRALSRLADLWSKGLDLDWVRFYPDGAPRRIGLPLYPFARERHWLSADDAPRGAPGDLRPAANGAGVDIDQSGPDASEAASAFVSAPAGAPASMTADTVPVMSIASLREHLRTSLAEVLLVNALDIAIDKPFIELGLDSILGVEWVKAINAQLEVQLAATHVYDYPTLDSLAAHLHAMLAERVGPAAREGQGGVSATPAPRPQASRAATGSTRDPAARSIETVKQHLRVSLAQALLMQPADIDVKRSFTELGLDSIIGVEWVNALNSQYPLALTAMRIYDYPNVEALAAFIAGQLPAAPASGRRAASGAIAFAPKDTSPYCDLAYYGAAYDGDFDADGECAVRFRLSPESDVSLREHVVFGEHLLPTDAYIELAYSAFRTYFDAGSVRIEHISIVSPLLGRKGEDCHVQVVFRRNGDALQFFVRSGPSTDRCGERLHMQGFIVAAPGDGNEPPRHVAPATFEIEQRLARAEIPTNTGSFYAPLESLAFGASHASADIRPATYARAFLIGPFPLYGGLCTVINHAAWLIGTRYGASGDQFLPHRIGAIVAHRPLDGRAYRCDARVRALERDVAEFDFELVDETGMLALSVEAISLRRVAEHTLRAQSAPRHDAPQTALQAAPARRRGTEAGKVAVIGMACRFPQSPDADAFWRNLAGGIDCVSEIPAERWPHDADWFHTDPRHAGTSYSRWAGLLDRIDAFDPLFFGISPAEAELIDPQQRIFLEECWKAIENAGYAPGALSGSACGVYVGCANGDYARVLRHAGQDTAGAAFMGTSSAILAARIAYLLNLKGPAVAVDTACSSSMVALHLACESIRNGENEIALTGGVNVLATPLGHILTSQVGMLSPDGRCAPFDSSANGIVFSEGCGVLLLKSLSNALADNDEILGVIEASGTNQDGRTNGITAPSSTAQERLLREVYGRFGVDARRIQYVEAHGTGTPLGDPIEVAALVAAFGAHGAAEGQCALGSVKGNIGHAGFAAGIAGIIKVLLSIRHGKLAPSIHYRTPNPHIELAASPFFVNTELRDWDSDGARRAAVSSFGFSGTNAHVVIAGHAGTGDVPRRMPAATAAPHALPLSARGEAQLREKVAALLAYLSDAKEAVDLERVAYTLQVGRDAMTYRAGFVAASAGQLAGQLRMYLDGARGEAGIHHGPATRDADAQDLFADDDLRRLVGDWLVHRNFPKLMNLWVRGVEVDWQALYADDRPRRLALPTYPFARERCWASGEEQPRRGAAAPAGTVLHPLLHRNSSDLDGQRYTSCFGGRERVLAEHRVNGAPVLAAAAYLEMVRAALADAMPGGLDGLCVQLRHVVWEQPLAVSSERSVTIDLYDEDDIGGDSLGFQVESVADDGSTTVHCHGQCFAAHEPAPQPLDLVGLRERMRGEGLEPASLYARFAELGLDYGPAYRSVVALHQGNGEALVELRMPTDETLRDCVLHPGVVDGALQGTIALAMAGGSRPVLPFALEALDVISRCGSRMVAWVRYTAGNAPLPDALVKIDIDLCDSDGTVCARMRGFSSRPMASSTRQRDADLLPILERVLNNNLSFDQAAELTRLQS
ncbi:1,4-dihydroxy-2-naphthoyl-CoA synthase [Paraburkholderia humisilvae]|uniref:1,4-dihydroxy-2-naphthoyl-CoA synthase n=2 Tax=Paraburkholderia humisilvae TaxID=627669 RepID=A0A6J5EJD6_9BURK|nr:1,4-dihydroxy-2-naphthoyl-CoA synthase [Paraburkholderia humisilvae]